MNKGFIQDTIRIIINNLNDDREHLSLQLALAQGLISENTFNRERAVYLIRSKFTHQDLVERVRVLRKFIGDKLSAEVVMTAFRCTIEEADAALREL